MSIADTLKRPARSLAVLLFAALAGVAPAQEKYPTRPIEFVIPFATGGPTNTAIRVD